MEFQTVILQKRDHVAKVSLNRPERLNAVNQQMFKELNLALTDVAEDSEIWVLVLTGEGRAFCASADMKEQRQGGDRLLSERSPYDTWSFIRSQPQQVTLRLTQMQKPTIAMVNGLAVGDGFDWVLACGHPHWLRALPLHERFHPDGPGLQHRVYMASATCSGYKQGPGAALQR